MQYVTTPPLAAAYLSRFVLKMEFSRCGVGGGGGGPPGLWVCYDNPHSLMVIPPPPTCPFKAHYSITGDLPDSLGALNQPNIVLGAHFTWAHFT